MTDQILFCVCESTKPLTPLREQVLMLAVADDEYAFAGAFPYNELEPLVGGIGGDERHGAVIVLARCDRALPLAEIEGDHPVFVEHADLAELFAGIARCQLLH